jgi:hypothetical protein
MFGIGSQIFFGDGARCPWSALLVKRTSASPPAADCRPNNTRTREKNAAVERPDRAVDLHRSVGHAHG